MERKELTDALSGIMDALYRSLERKEGPTRARAMNGDPNAAETVRRWNEEDTGIEFPAYMPDGSDVKSLEDAATMMGVDIKGAAYRVLNEPELDPLLYLEAKALVPDPESDTYGSTFCIMAVPHPDYARFIHTIYEAAVPVEELHVTLAFLGDVEGIPAADRARIKEVVAQVVARHPITSASVTGFARFMSSGSNMDPVVLLINSPDMETLRTNLIDSLDRENLAHYVSRRYGFIPHMTIGYTEKHESTKHVSLGTPIPFAFETVLVADGGDHTHINIPTALSPRGLLTDADVRTPTGTPDN